MGLVTAPGNSPLPAGRSLRPHAIIVGALALAVLCVCLWCGLPSKFEPRNADEQELAAIATRLHGELLSDRPDSVWLSAHVAASLAPDTGGQWRGGRVTELFASIKAEPPLHIYGVHVLSDSFAEVAVSPPSLGFAWILQFRRQNGAWTLYSWCEP